MIIVSDINFKKIIMYYKFFRGIDSLGINCLKNGQNLSKLSEWEEFQMKELGRKIIQMGKVSSNFSMIGVQIDLGEK